MSRIGLILLAAGGSTRMGRPKQLLIYDGQPLLRRAAQIAIDSACSPIIVVLGAASEESRAVLRALTVQIEVNEQWARGMGSSLRHGMQRLMREETDVAAAIILLCDQPHVTADVLRRLAEAHASTGKRAIACSYAGAFGPPCLFAASRFDELLRLPDDRGAKSVLAAAAAVDDLHLIPFPQGAIDLDTPADVAQASRASDSTR
jgi:molybdenum cofactor cytidylyltransferase